MPRINHRHRRKAYTAPRGYIEGSTVRRMVSFYPPDEFEALDERAQAVDIAPGQLQRKIVSAWLRGEPRPIFVGIDERS